MSQVEKELNVLKKKKKKKLTSQTFYYAFYGYNRPSMEIKWKKIFTFRVRSSLPHGRRLFSDTPFSGVLGGGSKSDESVLILPIWILFR